MSLETSCLLKIGNIEDCKKMCCWMSFGTGCLLKIGNIEYCKKNMTWLDVFIRRYSSMNRNIEGCKKYDVGGCLKKQGVYWRLVA